MSPETTTPLREPGRLASLRRLRLLDTPPEEAFDRLTRLASRSLRVPIALVNLIDEERQFFKSAVGMGDVRELPVGTGVCSYAVASGQPLLIDDARLDPRFASNPIVTDRGLVSYIGIPLITSEGYALGTFCVVDTEPRAWTAEDLETMGDLAASVVTEIELRFAAGALDQKAEAAETARAAADAAHQSLQELIEGLEAVVWEADAATRHFSYVSRRAEEVLGYPVERWLHDPEFWRTYIHEDDQERVAALCATAIAAGRHHQVEFRAVAADGRTVWLRQSVRVLCDPEGCPRHLRGVMTDVTAHKEAEISRAESEGRYRSLAEDALGTSEVGTFVLDADFHVAWANQAVERFFGLSHTQVMGADKRRLVREHIAHVVEDGERFAEKVLRTYDDNSAVEEFECRILATDAQPERWLAHRSRPIRDGLYAGGRIEHYYDVTERKRIEAYRARLAAIVESASSAIIGLGLDGTIESWNSAAEQMFGYRAEEVIGRSAVLLSPPGHEGEVEANLKRLFQGGQVRQFETVRLHKDGHAVEVSITSSPVHDAPGRIIGFSSILHDIGEQKRAHERIRFQAQLLNAVGQAVIATDPQGRITYWNRAAEALYGWRQAEVLGRDVVQVTSARMTHGPAAELTAHLEAGEVWSGELLVRHKSGASFPVMVHETPIVDGAGKPVGVVGISWDLTGPKRAEEALRSAKEEAERANRSKTEFLSAMSHELRTPLNAIAGYRDLIDLGVHGPVTDAQRESLNRIKRNQEHLLALVNDILHFAKIESGTLEFRMAGIPVDDVVAGVEAVIEPQAQARGIAYTCERPGPGLAVHCDPDRVQQILLNLAGNATKFTDPGGWVRLSCDADDEWVHVRVTDNGRGIAPERLESVFDPFVQLQRHRNETSQQGVGLGLAISRDLARGMGGNVTAESESGKGSTFTLHLRRFVATPGG